jgi:hypothetical protein
MSFFKFIKEKGSHFFQREKSISFIDENASFLIEDRMILEKVNIRQQYILNVSKEEQDSVQALARVYESLCDKEKIAFLLAGGAGQLFRYQCSLEQERQGSRRGRTSRDLTTESLPIIS